MAECEKEQIGQLVYVLSCFVGVASSSTDLTGTQLLHLTIWDRAYAYSKVKDMIFNR